MLQFTQKDSLSCFTNTVLINSSEWLLYKDNEGLHKLIFKDNKNVLIKPRAPKIPSQTIIIQFKKIAENFIVCLSDTYCFRLLEIEDSEKNIKKTVKLNFVCPFCLKVFLSHGALHTQHMEAHKGPAFCKICKVIFVYEKIFYKLF